MVKSNLSSRNEFAVLRHLFGNIWIDLSLLFCDGLCYLKTGITSESFKFVGDMHSSLQLFLVFVRCDR